ncbi:MAG: molybdopterin cofactor-binding domain-containing protein [Phycisphaerae bacterium]
MANSVHQQSDTHSGEPSSTLLLKDVGSPSHDSSTTHVTGKSEFVDDRPMVKGELHCGLVYSPFARARLKLLDLAPALKIAGVECAITAADVAHNMWGGIFADQPVIAAQETNFVGEVVAVLGAQTKESLAQGLAAVVAQWEKLPDIRSIDEAVAQESFIGHLRTISKGDAQAALASSPRKIEGVLKIEGADHFYLESQAAVVYPREDGQLEVHSSTQHPTETQHVVAKACGIPFSDVVCVAKRLGGGFGGKETQASPFAAYAALVAKRTGRAARIVLTKDEDMIMTGKRNPFQIHYECGFDDSGKILALDAMLYSDGGAYADLSTAIMERALLHCDNAYFIPVARLRGQVCRTNFHPHTAFRGFGGPKGVALIEMIIEDIARVLGRDALDVRKLNCYGPGRDTTPYGQLVENNCLPELFETLEKKCDYRARRQEIDQWNKDGERNPHAHPRGLSLTAVKFGISFSTRFMNQGNALVNVHTDGTLQVSTGAVEMGQGVNSRIAALVAEQFGLPIAAVRIMPTSTEKNANTSPTAASAGTDLNGSAAVMACEKIKQRLAALAFELRNIPHELWPTKSAGLGTQPEIAITNCVGKYILVSSGMLNRVNAGANAAKNERTNADTESQSQNQTLVEFRDACVFVTEPAKAAFKIEFAQLVREAYFNRVSVSEYGHYATAHLTFDKIKGQGRPFLYFTQGVAASEVQLDSHTGEIKVLRVDMLMDVGRPVNHALDMGQVLGGFVQGMGWVTTEHLVYNDNGLLVSHSPSTYKIPSVQDAPRIFNADFIVNQGNTVNVRGTKATGEPPLLLAISVWTAVRDAIASARLVNVVSKNSDNPMTSAASHDHVTASNKNASSQSSATTDLVQLAIPATAERVLRGLSPEMFAQWESSPTP